MFDTMFDNLSDLPTFAQILIMLIALAGTPTGIITGIFAYVQAKARRRGEVRLENVENEQIKIKSDAATQQSLNENMRRLIEDRAEVDRRWQQVYNTHSERQVSIAQNNSNTMQLLSKAIDSMTASQRDLATYIEIQTSSYQQLRATITNSLDTFLQKQGETDVTVHSINERMTIIQQSLTVLMHRIEEMIQNDEVHIESQGGRHDALLTLLRDNNTELHAIQAVLHGLQQVLQDMGNGIMNTDKDKHDEPRSDSD